MQFRNDVFFIFLTVRQRRIKTLLTLIDSHSYILTAIIIYKKRYQAMIRKIKHERLMSYIYVEYEGHLNNIQ